MALFGTKYFQLKFIAIMLATARNAAANWKEEEYSDGKWEARGFQHLISHLKDGAKTTWKNTSFLVGK